MHFLYEDTGAERIGITMSDVKSNMYAKLFNAVTDAIQLLKNAQLETEEIFIDQEDAKIIPLRRLDKPEQS